MSSRKGTRINETLDHIISTVTSPFRNITLSSIFRVCPPVTATPGREEGSEGGRNERTRPSPVWRRKRSARKAGRGRKVDCLARYRVGRSRVGRFRVARSAHAHAVPVPGTTVVPGKLPGAGYPESSWERCALQGSLTDSLRAGSRPGRRYNQPVQKKKTAP